MAGIVGLTELQHTNGTSAATINAGGVISQPNKPIFQVGLSAYQAVANATLTKINFNDVQTSDGGFNIGNHFDTSNYWFKPTVSGYYHLFLQMRIENAGPDYLLVYIRKNGTTIRFHSGMESNAANVYVTAHTTTTVHMNGSSDYIEVYAQHNAGSTQNIMNQYGQTQFGGFLVG